MKSYRVPFYLAVVLLVAAIAFIIVQVKIIRRLTQETPLRMPEPGSVDKLREENFALAEELKAIQERTDAEHRELLRLRGQVSALRDKDKEIAQLKSEREKMARDLQPVAPVAAVEPKPEETPERRFARARLNYSRNIGLALVLFANANQEQLPASLDGIDPKSFSDAPEYVEHNIQMEQFELTYKGRLNEAPEPSRTVLAREREPVQRADGTWTQTFVFVDGHAEIMSAPTREQLAIGQKGKFILPTNP